MSGDPSEVFVATMAAEMKKRWDLLVGPESTGTLGRVPGSWTRAQLCEEMARAVIGLPRKERSSV